ncbi:MAG: 3',5'-cyclic-nucleotide phosphodiesterase [Gammaproteobacteria bacterium]|nr:3',5'-cyclic-nucleotide phosphodiesterase [Gammaproteobacteria bacterium]MDH5801073.1 3',5'-cyclic-nucleotide phosphodiesterase [Gammaproteobacteria bacterium]
MEIRVLGCSGGIGEGLRTTSFLLDDDVLIDAGSGVGDLTLDEMRKIRHIFLTHSHMDHFAFLPLLVDSIFDTTKQPIIIHGQAATLEALQKHIFNWVIWPDFAKLPTVENPVMSYEVMTPDSTYTLGDRTLEMIAVNHIVPGVGYRIACDNGVFAFSGDSTCHDNFWLKLNERPRLDVLVVEAAFANHEEELSIKAGHYTPKLLAADLAKLKHQPEIYITHTKPGQEDLIVNQCQEAIQGRSVNRLYGGERFKL